MDTIAALQFKLELNKALKRWHYNFEAFFDACDPSYLAQFAEFKRSRIGQIWLTKEIGQRYLHWQESPI